MTNIIKHKRSSTSGSVPSPNSLSLGELAINTVEAKLFTRKSDGTIVDLTVPKGIDGGEIIYDSLLNDLLSFWLFNQNVGNIPDVSGNGKDFFIPTPPEKTDGINEKAISFSHKNFVYSNDNFSTRKSLSFWIKVSSFPTQDSQFITFGAFGSAENSSNVKLKTNGKIYWTEKTQTQATLESTDALIIDDWNHVVLTRDESSIKIYINGSISGSSANSYGNLSYDASDVLMVGLFNNSNISLDCMGAWSKTLTQEEVSTLYGSGSTAYQVPEIPTTPIDPEVFINISSSSQINSLSISVNGSAGVLFPSFNTNIHDYGILTNSSVSGASVSYTLTINGTSVSSTGAVNKLIRINYESSYYYIRLLPSDMPLGTIVNQPSQNYIPGYYVATSRRDINAANYNIIYNEYGLPIWYTTNSGTPHLHQPGNNRNRTTVSRNGIGTRYLMQISDNSIRYRPLSFLPTSRNGNTYSYDFGNHELLEISSPPNRRGNVVYNTFVATPSSGSQAITDKAYGVYVQEQAPDGTIAWEWWTSDRFDQTNLSKNASFFHMNSVDVHPVTGDMLMSCRQCSAIICVEYSTKNVKWIIQGTSQPWGNINQTANAYTLENAQFLDLDGEPELNGYQYLGPEGQHHAKWATNIDPLTPGNSVISVFDNQVGFFPGGGVIIPKTVTSLIQSGTTVTGTATNHGFSTGSYVKITGADQSIFNGIFTVTVINSSTFTYTVENSGSQTATGTLRAVKALTYYPHSVNSPAARGIIYEIDLSQNKAIHRSSAFAPNGISGYLGSYQIIQHNNGIYSHVLDFNQQHPQLVEYEDTDNSGASPGDIIYSVNFPGDIYRITKVEKEFFDLDYMRATAGSTPIQAN